MLYLKRGFINALMLLNDTAEGKEPSVVPQKQNPPTQATGLKWETTNGVTHPVKLQQFFTVFSDKEALNTVKNCPLDSIKWAHKDDSIWIVLGDKVVPNTQAFEGQDDAIWHLYWLFKHFTNEETAMEVASLLNKKMKGGCNV